MGKEFGCYRGWLRALLIRRGRFGGNDGEKLCWFAVHSAHTVFFCGVEVDSIALIEKDVVILDDHFEATLDNHVAFLAWVGVQVHLFVFTGGENGDDVRHDLCIRKGGIQTLVVVVGVSFDDGPFSVAGNGKEFGMRVDAGKDGERICVKNGG